MQCVMLKAKIHQACVTHCAPDLEGSCVISEDLMELAGIREYEQIHIYNVTNGERFSTYAMKAEATEGIISINGAATHKARIGDRIVICSYAHFANDELENFKPSMVYLSADNSVSHTANASPVILS